MKSISRFRRFSKFKVFNPLKTGVSPSLYINPELLGGGDITSGDPDTGAPEGHIITFATADATYQGADDGRRGAYIFNPTRTAAVRTVLRQSREAGELPIGRTYRFSAEVFIEGFTGDPIVDIQELRGINVNNNDGLIVLDDRENADHSGTNGRWERVQIEFAVIGEPVANPFFFSHGVGVINDSGHEQRTRNISLRDIGEYLKLTK